VTSATSVEPVSELQSLVDGLGRRLRRAVELEDAHGRLLAFNSQHGPLDDVRRASILDRKSPTACLRWAHRQGIREACAPVRLPRNPQLGMQPRICAPVRRDGRLLGHVWLIDPDESLSVSDLATLQETADAAAETLYAAKVLADGRHGRTHELLRKLLSDDPALRIRAERDLAELELFVTAAPVIALVIVAEGPGSDGTERRERLSFASGLNEIARMFSPGSSLTGAVGEEWLLLANPHDRALRGRTMRDVAERLREAAGRHHEDGRPLVVGIGDEQPASSAAHESYQHARVAARIARAFPQFRPIAPWDDLGPYRLIGQLPRPASLEASHAGLARLVHAPGGGILVETLERYLDFGCDAQRTAADLGLHRTSLYQRLEKIHDIAFVDLRDGEQRLALHLSLKLARLAELPLDN
jgi:hypothetical protein